MIDLQANKDKFIQIFNGEIHREGAAEFLAWLESTDFFEAPFSGQYTLSCKGGLCQHALNRYRALASLIYDQQQEDPNFLLDPDEVVPGEGETPEQAIERARDSLSQSVAIAGLLSGIGYANSWVGSVRNVLQPDGKYVKVPSFRFEEEFMFGGIGGKSVFIIQQFMRLFIEEAQAIRFHKQGKEQPYGESIEPFFYQVYETNLFAALVGVAESQAQYVLDAIVWNQIKPR